MIEHKITVLDGTNNVEIFQTIDGNAKRFLSFRDRDDKTVKEVLKDGIMYWSQYLAHPKIDMAFFDEAIIRHKEQLEEYYEFMIIEQARLDAVVEVRKKYLHQTGQDKNG